MAPAAPLVVPAEVESLLARLWQHGHAAYVVGGGVRDALLGRAVADWDIATDARPERVLDLFPGGHYGNRFGTVTIGGIEVTTFRRDHVYADHRRPASVTFTDSIEEDLARRDFTVNAIAYGRAAGQDEQMVWVDPGGGLEDLVAGCLRAVGDPLVRFDEDALRLLRAARLAAQLGFEIEPRTLTAMSQSAHLVGWLSSERVGNEFRRMLATDPPSVGFRLLYETKLLAQLFLELAAQVGVPQSKIPGHDLWQHSLATLDAAAAIDPANERLRAAALLHDIGKPDTFADGRFLGHDEVGARLARQMLTRLAFPREMVDEVAALIREHMFHYLPEWSDAAIRRFIRRVGPALLDDLMKLRQADNVGSGLAADAGHTDELRRRIATELERAPPLTLADLAVDGGDLMRELELPPGPIIGRLLERLLDSVIDDPRRNDRRLLLADARSWLPEIIGK